MEVYHTSNIRVEVPDTKHSRRQLDFGSGFYFTTIRVQAEKYAWRFFKRQEPAWLNIYEFSVDRTAWKVKYFAAYDEEWLDFVMACRAGETVGDFDMIIGGVADDSVFDTLDLYTNRLISKQEALQRLMYEKPNVQYCVRSEAMLRKCITFKESVRL